MKISLSIPSYLDHSMVDLQNNIELPDEATIIDLFVVLKLPEKMRNSHIYLVNGAHRELNETLKDGDRVVFFPIMAGG